jgi:small ligand-binding sensory domain FIST
VVRVMFALTPEGAAVCGGDIPEGATMSVGHIDAEKVLSTTRGALSKALLRRDDACFLIFSCVGRYFALAHETTAEMELVQDVMKGNEIPFMFVYSGGEMCPVGQKTAESGELTNRNHNDTFVLCRL